MLEARHLLLAFLSFAVTANSYWYIINGDPTAEFSLCRRLGFFSAVDYYGLLAKAGLAGYAEVGGRIRLQVLTLAWQDFLLDDDHGLSVNNVEYAFKRFDLDAAWVGKKQERKQRSGFHLIRLGGRDTDSYVSNIGLQKNQTTKRFVCTPLRLASLRSQQRTLTRGSHHLIADVIVDHDHFSGDAAALAGSAPPRYSCHHHQDSCYARRNLIGSISQFGYFASIVGQVHSVASTIKQVGSGASWRDLSASKMRVTVSSLVKDQGTVRQHGPLCCIRLSRLPC